MPWHNFKSYRRTLNGRMAVDDRNSGDDGCPSGFEDCTLNNNKNIVF